MTFVCYSFLVRSVVQLCLAGSVWCCVCTVSHRTMMYKQPIGNLVLIFVCCCHTAHNLKRRVNLRHISNTHIHTDIGHLSTASLHCEDKRSFNVFPTTSNDSELELGPNQHGENHYNQHQRRREAFREKGEDCEMPGLSKGKSNRGLGNLVHRLNLAYKQTGKYNRLSTLRAISRLLAISDEAACVLAGMLSGVKSVSLSRLFKAGLGRWRVLC